MTILKSIVAQKQQEVAALYALIKQDPSHPIAKIMSRQPTSYAFQSTSRALQPTCRGLSAASISFRQALQASDLAIIAEIKRQSPSKGKLASIPNPINLAQNYFSSGANAISVITDELFFAGNLCDLMNIAQHEVSQSIPILRKDFIIDKIQIAQSAYAGAQAILLIVAILQDKLAMLLQFAQELQLEVLVEIHNQQELELALAAGADILGVNNRCLKTFHVDTMCATRLVEHIPPHITKVAESGISEPSLARHYKDVGFDAVLIGEALVQCANLKEFMQACRDG